MASEAGRAGRRTVVFVHGSLCSGAMWRGYARALADRYDVLAPDLVGYGARPAWPEGRPFRLADEVAAFEEAIAGAAEPFDIVAHSYGGLVALRFAWANPARVRSLMLFEPTVFRVLADAALGSRDEHDEILAVSRRVAEGIALGAPEAAMCGFIDYWNGPGSWRTLPEERRCLFASQAATVARNFEAGDNDDMPLSALRRIDRPALIVAGARSTAASLATTWAVASQLPRAGQVTVAGAGHMMPLTHPEESLRLIAAWLDEGRVALRTAA